MQEAGAAMPPPRPDDGAVSVLEQRLDPCNQQSRHADELHEDEKGRTGDVLEWVTHSVGSDGRLMLEGAFASAVLDEFLGVVERCSRIVEEWPQQG